MALFGIRNAIKRTVNTLVGKPDIVAGAPPAKPPKTSPFAAPAAPEAAPAPAPETAPTPDPAPAPAAAAAPEPAPSADAPAAEPAAEPAADAPETKAAPTGDGPQLQYDEVWELLDDMVRPALQGDGGDITLIKVEDNDVHVRLTGACSTCPSSIMTMKMGVEALLREEFPHMRELVQHDA